MCSMKPLSAQGRHLGKKQASSLMHLLASGGRKTHSAHVQHRMHLGSHAQVSSTPPLHLSLQQNNTPRSTVNQPYSAVTPC